MDPVGGAQNIGVGYPLASLLQVGEIPYCGLARHLSGEVERKLPLLLGVALGKHRRLELLDAPYEPQLCVRCVAVSGRSTVNYVGQRAVLLECGKRL